MQFESRSCFNRANTWKSEFQYHWLADCHTKIANTSGFGMRSEFLQMILYKLTKILGILFILYIENVGLSWPNLSKQSQRLPSWNDQNDILYVWKPCRENTIRLKNIFKKLNFQKNSSLCINQAILFYFESIFVSAWNLIFKIW